VFDHLEEWRTDPEGGVWLDALPGLVSACVQRWSLQLEDPWTNSRASLAIPANRGSERLVLKMQGPGREARAEAAALARWNGNGAVRLVEYDQARRAMLLERCEPGLPLSSVEPSRAIEVVIGLLPRLWVPAGEGFRPLAEEASDLAREMWEHWERTRGTVDERLIRAAADAFDVLVGTQGEQVLVNQDLHAENILSARREPWLVIDPAPLAGEREFGAASIVRGRELGHSREAVRYRLDRLSDELGLDRERVRLWTIAHTAAWGFSESPLQGHMELVSWLFDAA
jgi:streptomycin 6-kinase